MTIELALVFVGTLVAFGVLWWARALFPGGLSAVTEDLEELDRAMARRAAAEKEHRERMEARSFSAQVIAELREAEYAQMQARAAEMRAVRLREARAKVWDQHRARFAPRHETQIRRARRKA